MTRVTTLDPRSTIPRHRRRALLAALALALLAGLLPRPADATSCPNAGISGTPYEGFGRETRGGAGKPTYRVTNLADDGAGSLRDALSRGDRCIVFDVAGDIWLRSQIYVRGAFLTVDGFTAPAPGLTLRDYGIAIWGSRGAHDVVLRGIRFRNAGQRSCEAGRVCYDGIQIKQGAYRVVVDHVSSDQAADGALDVGGGAPGRTTADITVQWSILSGTRNQVLLQRAVRISMHHNLLISGRNRNPQADWDHGMTTLPPDTVLDFRNNLVWNFSGYGTIVRRRATANVMLNYYRSSRPAGDGALKVDRQGRAYATGNRSANGADVDASSTEQTEFPAVSITTSDPCTAAHAIRDGAGARGPAFGLDAVDRAYVAQMPASRLPDCSPGGPPPGSARASEDGGGPRGATP